MSDQPARPLYRALPLIAPTAIPPHPIPTEVSVGEVPMPDGTNAVVLQFVTPSGAQLYFVEKATAKELAKKLEELGGGSNIVLVPAGAGPRLVP